MATKIVLDIRTVSYACYGLYVIICMAFQSSGLEPILRYITLLLCIMSALTKKIYVRRSKYIKALLAFSALFVITCIGSFFLSDTSQSLITTEGRLKSTLTIQALTMLTALGAFGSLKRKSIEMSFIVYTAVIIFASFLQYSIPEIINGVLLGESADARIGSRISTENLYGMVLSCLVIFSYYRSNFSKKRKWLYYIVILLLSILIAASGSRTALLGLVIGFCTYVVLKNKHGRVLTAVRITIAVVSLLYIMSFLGFTRSIFERISTVWLRNDVVVANSDLGRMKMISLALKGWMEKPLFGWGFNSFTLYNGAYGLKYTYSHNNYVELLFDCGFFGFITYYGTKVVILRKMFRLMKTRRDEMSMFLTTCLILLLIYDMTIVSYYYLAANCIWIYAVAYINGNEILDTKIDSTGRDLNELYGM